MDLFVVTFLFPSPTQTRNHKDYCIITYYYKLLPISILLNPENFKNYPAIPLTKETV